MAENQWVSLGLVTSPQNKWSDMVATTYNSQMLHVW